MKKVLFIKVFVLTMTLVSCQESVSKYAEPVSIEAFVDESFTVEIKPGRDGAARLDFYSKDVREWSLDYGGSHYAYFLWVDKYELISSNGGDSILYFYLESDKELFEVTFQSLSGITETSQESKMLLRGWYLLTLNPKKETKQLYKVTKEKEFLTYAREHKIYTVVPPMKKKVPAPFVEYDIPTGFVFNFWTDENENKFRGIALQDPKVEDDDVHCLRIEIDFVNVLYRNYKQYGICFVLFC